MIPFASQRGSGSDLAAHLMNSHDNEIVELAQIRGSIADDLDGAFAEWQVQADALTKAKNYLYSLSINPDPRQGRLTREQYEDYISRVEDSLGLADQPRATVFHSKSMPDGRLREHCHVVWSRIDCENERAIPIAFDREKLMRITIGFAKDHGLELPSGYRDRSPDKPQLSLHEKAQQERTGITREERMELVTQLWTQSDSPKAFVAALEDNGYMLASGKRPYILVDIHGQTNSLPKLIDDRSVRTKDIRQFLERDFPSESLPSVEDAKVIVADVTTERQTALEQQQQAERLEALQADQSERRQRLNEKLESERQRADEQLAFLIARHSDRQEALAKDHAKTNFEIEFTRAAHKPQGLAAFLGRITGVEFVRQKMHERERAKREEAQRLEAEQQQQRHAQQYQDKMQMNALIAVEQAREREVQRRIFEREKYSLSKQDAREKTQVANCSHEHQAPLPEKLRQTKFSDKEDKKPKTIHVEDRNLPYSTLQNEDQQTINLTDEFIAAVDRPAKDQSDGGGEFRVAKEKDRSKKR